jgi:hypothetical protein
MAVVLGKEEAEEEEEEEEEEVAASSVRWRLLDGGAPPFIVSALFMPLLLF